MLSTVRDTLNLVRNPRSKLAQIYLKKQKNKITCCTLSMASSVYKGEVGCLTPWRWQVTEVDYKCCPQ